MRVSLTQIGFGTLSAIVVLACAGRARAQFEGEFATTLEVDASYVTGVNGATDIAFHSDGRAVVTQKNGQIAIRRTDGTKNVLSGTFSDVDTNSEKGLLGVVSDPATNTFYFYVSNGPDGDKHRVYRGTLGSDDTLTIDTANPVVAESRGVGPGLEGPANHDGGGLFIHEGHLYVGVGDTGANSTPPTNKYSSCLNKPNGKILRVNLDGSIPSDNPLRGVASVTSCTGTGAAFETAAPDERIFAWGFRNPWRFWVDARTDLMWIGDVGETTREEISVGGGDQHYGYPFNEGTEEWGMVGGLDCTTGFSPARPCTAPVHDYDNGSVGSSVTGGLIPQGCGWTNAFGNRTLYIFADYGSNWINGLEVTADRRGVVSSTAIEMGNFSGGGPVSFRMGPDDAVYLVLNSAGAVYKISPAEQTGPDCGASGSGGTGGAGGSGGSAGAATGGSTGAAGGEADDGCGCRVVGRAPRSLSALALLGLLGGALVRRRRSRLSGAG